MAALLDQHRCRSAVAISAQIVIAALSFGLLALTPPAEGEMMLVPLTAHAAQALPAWALRNGTRLIATGPLPGSLLVYGRRSVLTPGLLRHATLVLATPPGGCTTPKAAIA
jgi:hypothetical protein